MTAGPGSPAEPAGRGTQPAEPAGPSAEPPENAPPESAAKPGRWSFPRTRRYLARFSMAGLTGALICYCLSLTPSLLPRAWFLQAVMSGITTVIGYAIGVLVGWLLRSLVPWSPGLAARGAGRWALAAAAAVRVPLFGLLGAPWQHDIRQHVDASQPSEARYILVVIGSILIAAALITLVRGIGALVRLIARPLRRFLPHRAATALAVLVVVLLLGFLATGVLPGVAIATANRPGSCTCRTPPTRSSGGPGSWPSTSRTGFARPTPPTCRRPCTGTRS